MRSPNQRFPAGFDGPGTDVTDLGELLVGYLDWYREALTRKLAGLSEERLRSPVEPLGWSPLGLVKHLGWVERRWLSWGFAAEDVAVAPPGDDDAEWRVSDGESTADVLADYRAATARAREIIAGAALSDRAAVGGRFTTAESAPTLGRILFHLLQEYARHVGHLDIARELVDGSTGE
ncbi:DinB family protein [Micromonospora zhanjiangensis]|uniref:DinB family protein n=1 Tax=Micromonospora zhanjiangensis TaxID=1522057 RepID=A0ABV8KKU3_9ACTN